ncbi:MAG TPA: ABC transporter ATP-binding protein [Candidatus Saccharimonadia bacterium]|nr:ABC transporter ATP-binding protein [Candidatus Saccharimonadia bacterium]
MFQSFNKYKLVYGHLWHTYGQSWTVRIAFILQLAARVCKLIVLPLAISLIITGLSKRDFSGAQNAVFLYASFSLLLGMLTPLIKYVGMLGENKAYRTITGNYFSRLVSADLDYFHSNLAGYLTTATRQYVDSCMQLARTVRDRYLNTVLSIVFPLCIITYLDIWLGLVTLALSATQAAYLLWASHAITEPRTKAREIYKRNSGRMADIVSNILAVKATAQEEVRVQQVRQGSEEEGQLFYERYKTQAKLIAMREGMTVIFFLVLLWLTVHRMSGGHISITAAVLTVTYTATILTGIYQLSDDLDEHDDLIDKIIPAFEILNRKNTITDPAKPKQLHKVQGRVSFDAISFAYNKAQGAKPVFENFTLRIAAGQKVGVVGLSGAGKSTLAKLLLRFNDVDDGQILIDNIDIRNLKQTDVRKHIAYVPQEPLLFHASVRENILLSRPDATDKEVQSALQAAHALSFTSQLPEGLDSIVGERGVKLSGGQKQRIAIARAVLQHAPIILLDEATSALDSESEQIIKDSFSTILKGKTAIVIAHRLSTLSEMDRIVVIEKGTCVEDGTHDELLEKNGIYARLWKRQLKHVDE